MEKNGGMKRNTKVTHPSNTLGQTRLNADSDGI